MKPTTELRLLTWLTAIIPTACAAWVIIDARHGLWSWVAGVFLLAVAWLLFVPTMIALRRSAENHD